MTSLGLLTATGYRRAAVDDDATMDPNNDRPYGSFAHSAHSLGDRRVG